MGMESVLDGFKFMVIYVQDMFNQYFEFMYGEGVFLNCDVVDMIFVCIGVVDVF